MARRLAYQETDRKIGGYTRDGQRRIRCPRCQWSPGRHDRWSCACGHAWNTFDTRGICPACDAAWADTQCLRCQQWSPHDEWYSDDADRDSPA